MQIRTKANSVADGLIVQEPLNIALEEDKLDDGCILSISVYVETKSSPKKPFGERATMYPGPAPLPEIFLAELSGNNIKVHAAEVGAERQKALEQSESTSSTLQGDVESGSKWTVAGDGRMLVAASESAPSWVALQSVPSRASGTPRIVESQGGSSMDVRAPRRILLGSLAPQEDPPRRILLGARTSKEYAPSSFLLRGQSSSETISPERSPPGGLDSFVYSSFPPASGRIDVSIADADVRGNYLVDQLASGSTLPPSAVTFVPGRRETPTE
ncbi:hypothetical protein V501_02485 [Pseudogymnoascus sp. VKM F-4519 (FW-2642)]|nr:hypothetical protein V501_02485 [Pseudogymnoascus sp. VKM F-4519 (FW-2642)]